MKHLTILLLLYSISACKEPVDKTAIKLNSSNIPIQMDKKVLGEQLVDASFLKFANSQSLARLKKAVIDSFDIYDPEIHRVTHIDAEELAEMSFGFFLPSLNQILAKRNLKISIRSGQTNQEPNEITVNGESIQLFSKGDSENEHFWEIASSNFFKKINETLKAKGLDEQFYLLYGGNDLHSILLTSKQFEIIKDYYKSKPSEIPYTP